MLMEKTETVVLGGGCFWCTEAVFKMLKGAVSVMPGYAGGTKPDPTYRQVSGGNTGHTEVIKVLYDPARLSFEDLLTVFFNVHDPTSVDRQGNDVGTQYRSVILTTNDRQKTEAERFVRELVESKAYEKPIVTEIRPLENFYPAEDYHRDYYANNQEAPYCQIVIAPKLEKVRKRFETLIANT